MKRQGTLRIRFLSVGILLLGVLLTTRLYYVQILHGEELSYKADRQYVRPNNAMFNRGDIFFSTKDGERVSAATLKTGFIVSINPTLIENAEEAYNELSSRIELDRGEFFAKAGKSGDPYEEITSKVPNTIGQEIASLELPGVQIHKQQWRYYPGNVMASHTVGVVAYSGDELAGRYGLESFYEQILGRSESNVYVNFFAEIFSNIRDTITYSKEKEGSIVTSIEPTVQTYLEQILGSVQEEWSSETMGGIIMDPNSGEIIAMAALPTFDPNKLSEVEDISVFKNPLVENVYEMGSIVKPLTLAAGLDSGVITPNTTYYDAGYLVLNGSRIQNYDGKGRGTVNMQEVLNQSLNTGAAFVAKSIGNEKFSNYMYSYGIGKKSEVDLPNDARGLVSNLESPRDIEHATASYGQGIAFTPMTMTRALATLANGGNDVTPHVVKEIDYSVGISKKIEYEDAPISRMLTTVVDDALLDGEAKMDRYSIAAKTGTAQIPSNDGGYHDDRFLHTFFGYFPSYDPKFLVFLFNNNPRGVRYASETLTHPFIDITEFLINYYDIPPDR